MTLSDIIKKIEEIQKKNPHLEVYFDGDLFAICSRGVHEEEKKKSKRRKKKKSRKRKKSMQAKF